MLTTTTMNQEAELLCSAFSFYIHWPSCPYRHQRAPDKRWLIGKASTLFDDHLIVELLDVSSGQWKLMIQKVITCLIRHVSIYFLTIRQDIQWYFGVQKKQVTLPIDDVVVDQDEITNFSRQGRQSKNNSEYSLRGPYKGFGRGECSCDGQDRIQNTKNLLKYLKQIRNTGKSILFMKHLTEEQEWLERFMLGLRRREEIALADILEPLSVQKKEEFSRKSQELLRALMVSASDGRLMLTPQGLSVANEVIVRLLCI